MNGKLLLVDDNKHLRVTLGDHLAHEGFTVTIRESAEAALAYLEAGGETDLVILDINMPGLGGVGFLRRILDEDGKPRHPVLVLTARSGMGAFFDTLPVNGFLPKPCAIDQLLNEIRRILGETGESRHVAEEGHGEHVVLLAEDDPAVSDSIERLLRTLKCRVITTRTGPETLDEAARSRPRLIILKQLLPKMNGNIIAPLLAGMPSTRGTPILLYDDSRKFEDPGTFASRLPESVSRFIASNRAVDLVREAEPLLAEGPRAG